jgi:phosphoglycolate phosphatase-like HAD superfamily hydrolase
MIRVITDFDGLIVDLSDRYYEVYKVCLAKLRQPNQSVKQLTKREFWDLKRSRVPETQVAQLSGLDHDQASKFAQLRDVTAHTHPYFSLDTPIPGSIAALEKLQQAGVELAVMTLRRTHELNFAFQHYDLGKFFPLDRRYCLSDDHPKIADTLDKTWLMAQALQELPPIANTWMVGDTEADILAAQSQGLKVIATLSGIRDRTQLEHYQPDYILADLAAAVELILSGVS